MKTNNSATTIHLKTILCLSSFIFAASFLQAQLSSTAGVQTAGDYAITHVGPHSRIWRNSAGQSVTEIASGMHYWDGQQWTPSDPSFVVSPDRTEFVAAKILDPTKLAANLNVAGAVTVTTPDNVTLRSTPIAIGLYDAASGQSVIVATLTNTIGVLVDPQHVVYNKAFVGGGFAASVVYQLPDTGSFHQDVVFTGFDTNFDPTVWGFAANSTNTLQIQIWTEFYSASQPLMVTNPIYIEQDPATRASMASPDLIDYTLDFGDYVFGPGRACAGNGNAAHRANAQILKDFITSSGRTFLVESIPYRWLARELEALPPVVAVNTRLKREPGAKRTRVAAASLPSLREVKKASIDRIIPGKTSAVAVAMPKGITADYVATVSSTSSPIVYSADTTYFISGNVYDTAPVTLESAVFKFPIGSGIIWIEGTTLTMATTNYRPAIFTAADDNTVGTTLSTSIWSGYTGNPGTNIYGLTPLWLDAPATTNIVLNNLRFCYQYCCIAAGYGSTAVSLNVSHCQFANGVNGIILEPGNTFTMNVNNCLFGNVEYTLSEYGSGGTVNTCNCTFDSATYLFYDGGSYAVTCNFTNSIFSSITTEFMRANPPYSSFVTNGAYNGFYSATPFGISQTSVSSDPYQTMGAGNYYLPSTSLFLNCGTTNIPSALLTQLAAKTTQPPLILTNVFTTSTTLTPVAQRDTIGPALGFHYDPIDYISGCYVSNCALLLTNGVALAYYDNLGVCLLNGSQLVSQGAPNYRNYLVYYGLVQEQPVNLWGVTNAVAQLQPIVPSQGSSANPSIFLRLTTICAPQGETNLFNTADTGNVVSSLTLQDCEVYGAGANWFMDESTNDIRIGLTNNVFHRVPFSISNNATIMSYNNLFYGTTNTNEFMVSIRRRSGTSPSIDENNVFDGVTVALDGFKVEYNAYLHGATNIVSTNINDLWNNFNWQPGPLGAYYQPTNSPLLTNGSTYAANLGLYHYTVGTNEAVEGTNIVSRGYHYVAGGANGLPLDTSGDGIPNYLADTNGNNSGGSGSWSNYISPNGLTTPSGLIVFTPLK